MRIVQAIICTLVAAIPGSALANETIQYSYDAKGRLTGVQHAGSVNDTVATSYAYDAADNRVNVATTGATSIVVVPLGGLKVIVIRSPPP